MRPQLTPIQFAFVMTVLWGIAIVATVPITLLTSLCVVFIGTPAAMVFFYSLANFVLDYMPLAEARFNERFPSDATHE